MGRGGESRRGVAVAVVFALLFLAGLVLVTNVFDSTHVPSPDQPVSEIEGDFATRMTRRQVPVIDDDGFVVAESAAVVL